MSFLAQQEHVVVQSEPAMPVHLKALYDLNPGVDLLARDEGHAVLGQAEQKTVVDVAPVHRHDAALGERQPAGDGQIAPLALREHHTGGDVARMVEQGMQLDRAFRPTEAGPREQLQAQGDGGPVQGQEWAFEPETVPGCRRLTAGVPREQEA